MCGIERGIIGFHQQSIIIFRYNHMQGYKMVESTAEIWPNSQTLQETLAFPLAVSIQPLNDEYVKGHITGNKIPKYRCQSCKAFINNLCVIRNDHEYDCSICGCTNYVIDNIDRQMAQLNNSSYSLITPNQRILHTNHRLVVFAIDVSPYTHAYNYFRFAIHLIKNFINLIFQRNLPIKIMIIGFDDSIHRYLLANDQSQEKRVIFHCDIDTKVQALLQSGDFNDEICDVSKRHSQIIEMLDLIEIEVVTKIKKLEQAHLRSYSRSSALRTIIEYVLKASNGYSGKLFAVTGLNNSSTLYKDTSLSSFKYADLQQNGYNINKQAITQSSRLLLQTTQMSLSFYLISDQFVNACLLYYLAKNTNGQFRHYYPTQTVTFQQNLRNALADFVSIGFETVLRVRYSTGLKLGNMFGNYRETKINDQIDLISCPITRRYIFQFLLTGKITTASIVIQFSILYTDLYNNRIFVIITHRNGVSSIPQQILRSIDYTNISITYIHGVIFNSDIQNARNLRIYLQQRCKRHMKALKQSSVFESTSNPIRSYIISSFLLIKHFLLNPRYRYAVATDINADNRSKVATLPNPIHMIWPVVYAVTHDKIEIIEMKSEQINKASVGILIDRGDKIFINIMLPQIKDTLSNSSNASVALKEQLATNHQLKHINELIESLKLQKEVNEVDIDMIETIEELKILDLQGPYNYGRFLDEILSN